VRGDDEALGGRPEMKVRGAGGNSAGRRNRAALKFQGENTVENRSQLCGEGLAQLQMGFSFPN